MGKRLNGKLVQTFHNTPPWSDSKSWDFSRANLPFMLPVKRLPTFYFQLRNSFFPRDVPAQKSEHSSMASVAKISKYKDSCQQNHSVGKFGPIFHFNFSHNFILFMNIKVNNSGTSALWCKVAGDVFWIDLGNQGGAANKIEAVPPVSKEKVGTFLIRPSLPTHCPHWHRWHTLWIWRKISEMDVSSTLIDGVG